MARILVIYATTDGQARKVAQRVCESLVRAGHAVNLRAAGAPSVPHEIAGHDAVIVGGGIRYGHFPRALGRLAHHHAASLDSRPNAFFSVCLSGGGPGARPELAARYVEEFAARAKWRPQEVAIFGGALLYTRYNPFIRFLMRMIVGIAGGDTDASRDYEYTDWAAVERFAAGFAARLRAAQSQPLAA